MEKLVQVLKEKKIMISVIILLLIIAVLIFLFINNRYNYKKYEVEEITDFKYYLLNVEDKMGIIDTKGNIVVEPTYEHIVIPNPQKAVFVCENGDETTILNDKNKKLFEEYSKVSALQVNGTVSNMPYEKSVLKYEQDGKYGLISLEGKKITKPIYDDIESLTNKEAEFLVKLNGKCGVINKKGAIIIKPEYDNIQADGFFTNEDKYRLSGYITSNKTQDGYRYGYIDCELKQLLNTEYNNLQRVIEVQDKKDIYLIASKNGQVGLIKNDKTIIKFDYQDIEYSENNLFLVQRNLNYGVVNIEGKRIIPTEYEEISFYGLYIKGLKQEQETYFDLEGNKIENAKYVSIIPTENQNYLISTDLEGQYGVLTNTQEVLIQNNYEYIEYLFDDYFIAIKEQGKLGIINSKNQVIIDFKYDVLQKIDNTKIVEAKILNGNITHLYSKNLEEVATTTNGTIYTFDDYLQIYSPNEIKYFDLEGKELLNTDLFKKNKLFAKKENNKWGFVDKTGKNVIDFKYDLVTEFNEYGFAGINIDDKWGIIDDSGNIVVEPVYKQIEYNSNPEFLGKYYKVYYGYGECYYTDNIKN